MTAIVQVEVRRKAFDETRLVAHEAPPLADGEILARIDKFGLTANNVSYALSGDLIGYWKFFPVAEPWGVVPVWGFADVVESKSPDIKVGERIFGFLPMASHIVMRPGEIAAKRFVDVSAHRAQLPAIYNAYQRTSGDPESLKALEDERCILFGLFSTAYILMDYLADNAFFGAKQVIVGSASSKTGFGLCNLLSRHGDPRPQIVGLTSSRNVGFVKKLGYCDVVRTYEKISAMDDSIPTAFVDMAGDGDVVSAIHKKFGAQLKLSCAVGATHWGAARFSSEGSGVPHNFFFAPGQFLKREQDWGAGEVMRRATQESARMAMEIKGIIAVQHARGGEAVAKAFSALVANQTPPDVGVLATLAM